MNSLDEAKAAAEENGRPILLLIHKSWCGACKALRTVFADSDAIEHQAAHFNMVNLEDDEEPKDKAFQPDGGYIPRIMFLTSKGELQPDLINKVGNPKYKYYYSSEAHVTSGMEAALNALK